MSYSGIMTSVVVQEHTWHKALCEPLRPDGLTSLLQRLLETNQIHMCPHSSATTSPAWFGVQWPPLIIHKDNLGQPKPMCHCNISLSAGLFFQHTSLTFHQYFGDFCVAGTEGTVQLEPVSVVKKGSTQGKQHFLGLSRKKKKALGKKAHESQLVIFPSARSPEVSI